MLKMIMAIIPVVEAEIVINALIEAGHTATFLETKGGVMRRSQYSIFIVVDETQIGPVCKIIKKNCKTDIVIEEDGTPQREGNSTSSVNKLGGSVIFIWNLERMTKY